MRIGSLGTLVVALLPVRIPPQGADQRSIAVDRPRRYAGMEDRREWPTSKPRHEEVVRRFEGERSGALGLLLVPMVGGPMNQVVDGSCEGEVHQDGCPRRRRARRDHAQKRLTCE